MLALSYTPTRLLNQITRHIERAIGLSPMVFHEMIAANLRLDLHVIPPQAGQPCATHPKGQDFFTIVTSGISAEPMPIPGSAAAGSQHAELMITLPSTWPGLRHDGTFRPEIMRDEAFCWPIRWLKKAARLPHETRTSISAGQIISNGAQPFAHNTRFTGMIALPPVLHPKAARMVAHDDLSIAFLALWPIYPAEMRLAMTEGTAALVEAFRRAGVSEMVHLSRKSVA